MENQTIIRLLLIILAALVLFAIVSYFNRNRSRLESEKFSTSRQHDDAMAEEVDPDAYAAPMPMAVSPSPVPAPALGGKPGKIGTESFADPSSMKMHQEGYTDFPRPVMENDATCGALPNYDGMMMPTGSTSGKSSQSATMDGGVMPMEPDNNEIHMAVDYGTNKSMGINDSFPGDPFTDVSELLPKDAANTKWAQVNPAGQGDVKNQNFMTAGFTQGVDTVGQSLRNASKDLRPEPPNPRFSVSPWMQSTIEPDPMRRPLY